MALDQIYTHKQQGILRYYYNHDFFIMLSHGAVRAGKTQLNNDIFLAELKAIRRRADEANVAVPQYILAGFSLSNIQDNILNELSNKYGFEFKFDKYNNFYLYGVKVIQCAHGTIKGLGSIRGMTAWGAYVNEASLANAEVFNEIKFRCSAEGARIIGDTNPDHPEHWLKKDYIDKAGPGKSIIQFHFEITDNSFLSRRYIESVIESTPSGMMMDRGIKGLWTSGDGAVYKDFNKEIHAKPPEFFNTINYERFLVGVDWGWEHWGSMIVIGVWQGHYFVLEEIAGQYIPIETWKLHAEKITRKYGRNIPFYCDSARPDNISALVTAGFNALNAAKAIMAGIESVSYLIKNRRFYIDYEACPRFKQEIYNYIWDKRTGMPKKEFDDVLDAIRYGIYSDIVVQHNQLKGRSSYMETIRTMSGFGLGRDMAYDKPKTGGIFQ